MRRALLIGQSFPKPKMRCTGRYLRSPVRLTLRGHTDSVDAVALTPDGRLAVSASRDKTLKVWEVESGRELRTLKATPVPSMAWR